MKCSQPVIADEVKKENIASSARILGQSMVCGENTVIGDGAVVQDSYLENVLVEAGAVIIDSVCVTKGNVAGEDGAEHEGFGSRWDIRTGPTRIGRDSEIKGCTLQNSSVGARSRCSNATLNDCTFGVDNNIRDCYGERCHSQENVTVAGPTEVNGAWIGHHGTIDKCGFFEGKFTNDFYVIEFDEKSGVCVVKDTIDVPHVSRYGMNTINSTNSGKIGDTPDSILHDIGSYAGLWEDPLLSFQEVFFSPCCWVSGWTKIIGQSPRQHASAGELVCDTLATNLMPFSVGGLDGSAVMGQTFPGERHDAFSYKHRFPAWAFTCAPDAVIGMIQRIYAITSDARLADSIAVLALKNALALTHYHARERNVDLSEAGAARARGWKGWLLHSKQVLTALIDSGLWEFDHGEPVRWKNANGRWVPESPDTLHALVPDALDKRYSEEDLVQCSRPALPHCLGVRAEELPPSRNTADIDPGAGVSPNAVVGPGVTISGKSVIEDGVFLYRSAISDSIIKKGSRILRTVISSSTVDSDSLSVSSNIANSVVGRGSRVRSARIENSSIVGPARVLPYARVSESELSFPSIIGSRIHDAKTGSFLMSYHMPGHVTGLRILPSVITYEGREETVLAVPMLGGGLRVSGTTEKPVTMEAAFIGSNAILEAGAFVGFGSFVLGTVGPDEGLLPFTSSTEAGPARDQIGVVASQMAYVVLTHFVSWAFQANGPDKAELIAQLVRSKLEEGRDAVAWAIDARKAGKRWDENSPFARYKSLRAYTDSQLESGLQTYARELADDRWKMVAEKNTIRLAGKGNWVISGGYLRWYGDT